MLFRTMFLRHMIGWVELLIGPRVALALRVTAERRIVDLLTDGPKTAEALSIW